jgi:hypothetical protein
MAKKIGLLLIFLFSCTWLFWLGDGPAVQAQEAGVAASPLPPRPANDNFGRATVIKNLPFEQRINTSNATLQDNEPVPSCSWDGFGNSVWYAYTPPTTQTVEVWADAPFQPTLAIYTGNGLRTLSQLYCASGWMSFQTLNAGTTYYFQIGGNYGSSGFVNFSLRLPGPPSVWFNYWPWDPSSYDDVHFSDSSWDGAGFPFVAYTWDLGSEVVSTDYSFIHRFAQDGDYTVHHSATTADGRTGSVTQVIAVRTHDVGITRMTRPKASRPGQTRRLIVSVQNRHYPEVVAVELYKSTPSGFQFVGRLEQTLPVRSTPTDFYFSYTFTAADAAMGSVNFQAIATLVNARDALPGDNAFITLAVPVRGRSAAVNASSLDEIEIAADDPNSEAVDEISNIAASAPIISPTDENADHTLFLPLVSE